MEMTMNPDPENAIPRKEFEKMAEKPRTANAVPERQSDDVVRRGEFRLLLWIGAFALTTILGGFTFLYTAITDLRVEMERQMAGLRVEMEQQHAGLRVEMEQQHAGLRVEMEQQHAGLRSEMEQHHAGLRSEMEQHHADLRAEIASLGERVARIEVILNK